MNQPLIQQFDNLKIQIEDRSPETLHIWFDGEVHENFKARSIALPDAQTCVINLAGLRSINSLGVREWSQFLLSLSKKSNIVLEECSVVFIDQANIVPQILLGARVSSFFAPYFCPQCNTELNCKLSVSNHRKKLSERRAPQIIHSCGAELQFDALEESYFFQIEKIIG
ncbi:MAG: hypothetical protein RIR26_1847 [Pseudomonadota bacterium]